MSLQLIFCFLATVSLVRGGTVQELSAASSAFSQNLYQKIASNSENSIYSPYSIHSILALTLRGARGDTASEMSQALGVTSFTCNTLHQAYHDLIVQLNGARNVTLNTANAIFVNPRIPIETQFVNDAQRDYLASSSNFDLSAPEGPEKAINDYVERNTKGMIKNILPKGSIDAQTVMILVNTIFFNGTWNKKFDEYKTTKQIFQKLGGTTSQVDMMYDERFVNIKRNDNGVDVAELPFLGNRFSLYIVLPNTVEGITAFETSLTQPGRVDNLFEGLRSIRVKLSIPKFKIESTYQLKPALQQLGITKAFIPGVANFQGISSVGNLYISNVIHKAMIEVKESGTVAAAATVVGVKTLSLMEPPSEVFIADHPFLLYLRDKQSKQILFEGKLMG